MDIGPHRAPMLAALSRREQLLSRIAEIDPNAAPRAPTPSSSLAAVLAENVRLAQILADLERPEREPSDDELSPVVCDDSGAVANDPPLESPPRRFGVLMALGYLALVTVFVGFAVLAFEPKPAASSRPPHDAKTVRLTGAVVSSAGTIDIHPGEHCEITIADSGDRDAGRSCHIEVRCPTFHQGFGAASCPIGEPKGPVRLESNGIEIDELSHTATFIAGGHGEVIQGGATLRLDASR